jgi:hypothetical protein
MSAVKWWHVNLAFLAVIPVGLGFIWEHQTPWSLLVTGGVLGLLIGELIWRSAFEIQRSIVRRFVDAAEQCWRSNG